MHKNYTPSGVEIIFGLVGLLSWIAFCFCLATLKQYIDDDKVSKEDLAKLAKGAFPNKSQLTREGVVRYNVAIVAFLVGIILCGSIVIHKTLAQG
jgi:hypothetical protein